MRVPPVVYRGIATVLPALLGLGLIYLYGVGRIDAFTALASVIGGGVILGVVVALADIAAHDPARTDRRGRPVGP